ncbi:hypothetical protein SAMN05216316_1399 [Nitrosovibrio sp. Nv6]|nr:hypothetical protein SAMN05216316_1399 [Nitrosovibrio sp. Nv6]
MDEAFQELLKLAGTSWTLIASRRLSRTGLSWKRSGSASRKALSRKWVKELDVIQQYFAYL